MSGRRPRIDKFNCICGQRPCIVQFACKGGRRPRISASSNSTPWVAGSRIVQLACNLAFKGRPEAAHHPTQLNTTQWAAGGRASTNSRLHERLEVAYHPGPIRLYGRPEAVQLSYGMNLITKQCIYRRYALESQ